MHIYSFVGAIVSLVAGIVLAVCTKKAETVTYTKLDKAGRITNILLIPVYLILSPTYLFMGLVADLRYEGFWGVPGWLLGIMMASAALPCGISLGLSVLLRKKGKRKLSFAVQFAGFLGIIPILLLFFRYAYPYIVQ